MLQPLRPRFLSPRPVLLALALLSGLPLGAQGRPALERAASAGSGTAVDTGASLGPNLDLALNEVPLARLVGMTDVGNTYGVSFLDYDGDGWIDLYVNANARLWRNEEGQHFTQVADLDLYLPPILNRYGAAAGDYDNDGFPDLACSPRENCLFVLHNLGGTGVFEEVARDPALFVDPPSCGLYGETIHWTDFDTDGDLDLWVTAYPDSTQPGSDGNQFFENLGPTGPGGATLFVNRTTESGLGNPPNVTHPEGAVVFDVDRDGDPDAYANGTVYQNVSDAAGPRFQRLVRLPTGITLPNLLDEGVSTLDYDLDGDEDLLVAYKGRGIRVWENQGDGTFFWPETLVDQPILGATEGCSAEDWDLDGDLDITAGEYFRRNLLVETGERFLRIARHEIPAAHLSPFLTPAWGDFDRDGDPDCMLANWGSKGRFYRNTTYEPDTPVLEKLTVHVRPVRDADGVPRGLETEYGATVEVRVHDDPRGFVRRRTVASNHGYLQQSEYALTFALPPGPDPAAPARGVRFDLLVDFPSLPADGLERIDRSVNPILGNLELGDLLEREITVFRGGRVRLDGQDHEPNPRVATRLVSSGALRLPVPAQALPELVPAPGPDWFVGMELDTLGASHGLRVEELVLDGHLVPAGLARCDANVLLLDVTPDDAGGGRVAARERLATSERNHRSFLPLAWTLKPGRVWRVLCRVSDLRASPVVPTPGAELANRGGLSFPAADRCDPAALTTPAPEPDHAYLELRTRSFRDAPRRRDR